MESWAGLQMAVMKHCSVQILNNMKLEIGKLYKLNYGTSLLKSTGSNYAGCAKQGSIVLLLDFKLRKNSAYFNKFKVLTEDGIIGWIVTSLSAQMLSPQSMIKQYETRNR